MKVLFITNYADMYGANRALLSMMLILRERYAIEPILLMSGNAGALGRECSNRGIKFVCHNFRLRTVDENVSNKCLRKITRFCMRYLDYISVQKMLRNEEIEFDIVHSNSSIIDIGFYIAKWNKVPHVWHVREYLKADYGQEYACPMTLVSRNYLQSDAVISISKAIENHINALDRRICTHLIYDGVEICERYKKEYFKDESINICIVGAIIPSKNQLMAIEAVSYLKIWGIVNWKLYIVGNDSGRYYELLKNKIEEYGISDNVIFTGYRDDVDFLLHHMDIGLMPSFSEAFGRVTVEYMANYMPVIGVNSGATPEIVDIDSLIVQLNDAEMMAQKLRDFILDKKRIEEYGLIARKRAEQFTASTNADAIYDVYSDITNM